MWCDVRCKVPPELDERRPTPCSVPAIGGLDDFQFDLDGCTLYVVQE